MRYKTRIAALLTSLVLVAASFELFAQNASAPKRWQARNQQMEMEKRTVRGQFKAVGYNQKNHQMKKAENGKKAGPGNGTGNKGNPPKDGTGYGAKSGQRTGPQDGTGPRCGSNQGGSGKGRRGGRS